MVSSGAILSALFASGLIGSLGHCLGMCGPLVLMVGAHFPNKAWEAMLPLYLIYHGARILVYTLLGLLAGAIVSFVGKGGGLGNLAAAISLALGAGVILIGLGYLGWLPFLRRKQASAWLTRTMARVARYRGPGGVVLLGALNGLLPCGLVYGALLAAGSTASPLYGAAGMALFGLGTIPALLFLGVGAWRLSARTRQLFSRVAGVLIVLVGVQLVLRGTAGLGVISHQMVFGGLMLW